MQACQLAHQEDENGGTLPGPYVRSDRWVRLKAHRRHPRRS